jgi:hypothetical protein
MKERGEREYRKGVWWKKEKRQGFLGKMPFFLAWLASRTQGEGGRAGGRPAGVPAGDQRMEGNGEEAEGILFPYLPCVVAARRGGSTLADGGRWCRLWAAGSDAQAREEGGRGGAG